jgi:uncharacterized protein YbbC (DUF1343 family)/CubicO group peptidase (beta-lactamase class C family)
MKLGITNVRTPFCLLLFFILLACQPTFGADVAKPESVGVSSERLDRIDAVVREAIDRGQLPGAVVVIVHRDRVVFRRAYGLRSRKPVEKAMTPDTVFDLASLTKPVATATAVMLLVEQGKLALDDRVAKYLPAFGKNGKDGVTIEQLLLHTSGLPAVNALVAYRDGRAKAIERLCALPLAAKPGERFTYSDLGYILLAEIVERQAGSAEGQRVLFDEFSCRHIFEPLGMAETTFRPGPKLRARAAPTEERDGHWLVGEVHDPRAHLLGGVAGHAGLFSTADDLAIFVRMLLRHGEYRGRRLLSPAAVRLMSTPRQVPRGLRAYGWDVHTAYSPNRGELFPRDRGFGHTGFTGTSLWLDPDSDTAVIFLSNRVHPDGKGNINRLRGQVATLAASSIMESSPKPITPIATGIDILVREKFRRLRGRKVGLVTNHTGRDRDGRSTIDLLHQADGVKLVALFSPEHGIRGAVDAAVPDTKDAKTGLPVYSLYGRRRKPTAETLKGIDTLVFDIQDAGCRFYTYISTLGYVLEAAKEHGLRVLVLDRPNPIGGFAVEGPVLDAGRESFVAYYALPVRHGLTVGELARLFNAERKIGADLEVVRMEGWRRGDLYDRTGLVWVNPSPNLRSLPAALLYPGIGLLETTNVSVGRGTERPFEWIGAPWIDGRRMAAALGERGLPGVRFVPVKLTPSASTYRGTECGGVQIIVDDWLRFQAVRTGLTIAAELRRLYPEVWQADRLGVLLGHRETLDGIRRGLPFKDLEKGWQAGLKRFLEIRRGYLFYGE